MSIRVAVLPLPLLLLACPTPTPTPEVPTPTPQVATLTVDASGVVDVPRILLNTPFLLSAASRTSDDVSGMDFYRTRVVSFVEGTGGLSVVELSPGSMAPASGDRELWLLPEISSDEEGVQVDFVAGATTVYVQPDLYDPDAVFDELALPVTGVFDSAAADEDAVILRAMVSNADFGIEALVVYGLVPFVYDEAFDAREPPATRALYQTWPTPTPSDAAERSLVLHHDTREPIPFFYTLDTPTERVADLQTSIDFWNAALQADFGSPPLTLAPLPDGVNVMDPGVHVVRWFEDPSAGTGRGIMQADPYTGRITKALVSVCSVFGYASDGETTALVQMAQRDAGQSFADPTPLQLERAASAYFVNTYTHELGHVLGLRHNFAASLDGEVSSPDVMARTVSYLVDGEVPTTALASSVMEYVAVPHVITTGARIQAGSAPGPHDVAALQAAYGSGVPSFGSYCEAEGEPVWADCVQFDFGPRSIVGAYEAWEATIERTAFDIARTVAAGADPYPADIQGLILGDSLQRLSNQMAADAALLSVASTVDPSDAVAYRAAVTAEQLLQYQDLSGPHVALVQAIIANTDVGPSVQSVRLTLEADTIDTLEWLGATPDVGALAAYFDEVEAELTTVAETLRSVQHVPVGE